jgi:hypothetical protein
MGCCPGGQACTNAQGVVICCESGTHCDPNAKACVPNAGSKGAFQRVRRQPQRKVLRR